MRELIKRTGRYHAGVGVVAYHQEGKELQWWIDLCQTTVAGMAFGPLGGAACAIFGRYLNTPEQQALLGSAVLVQSRAQTVASAAAGGAIRSGVSAVGGSIGGAMEGLAAHGRTGGGGAPRQHVH